MNSQLVVLIGLVFGHFVLVNNQPAPSFLKQAFDDIVDVITNGVKASPHIMGGSEVVPHSYPYLVGLTGIREGGYKYRCAGSLITPEWVLTAAHCIVQPRRIIMTAHLGGHNLSAVEPHRQDIDVKEFLNPYYERRLKKNDIALLKLERPATLNEYVQTIRLPALELKKDFLRPRTPVILSGWGMYSNSTEEASQVPRSVQTRLISKWTCDEFFAVLGLILPNAVACTDSSGGKGTCMGDSGGPMVITDTDGQKTLIGVASFGIKDCTSYPSVFTRVDQYLEWISEHTGIALREK